MNDETTVEERPLQGRVTGLADFAGFSPSGRILKRICIQHSRLTKKNSASFASSAVMV